MELEGVPAAGSKGNENGNAEIETLGTQSEDPLETNTYTGISHSKHTEISPGRYPDGVDVSDIVGTIRTWDRDGYMQYIEVVGDYDGHAVYRNLNEKKDSVTVWSQPWTEFLDKTVHIEPDAPGVEWEPGV